MDLNLLHSLFYGRVISIMKVMKLICNIPVVVVLLLSVGCRQEPVERICQAVWGEAQRIDLNAGLVFMDWVNEKTGEKRTLRGRFSHDSEILINGVAAQLSDLCLGDRGIVIAYQIKRENPGTEDEWIVAQVLVEREESFIAHQPLPSTRSEEIPNDNSTTADHQ